MYTKEEITSFTPLAGACCGRRERCPRDPSAELHPAVLAPPPASALTLVSHPAFLGQGAQGAHPPRHVRVFAACAVLHLAEGICDSPGGTAQPEQGPRWSVNRCIVTMDQDPSWRWQRPLPRRDGAATRYTVARHYIMERTMAAKGLF